MSFSNLRSQQDNKPSAFYPVSPSQVPFICSNSNQSPPNKNSLVIFESQEQSHPEHPFRTDEHLSEDYYCMTCHQNYNIKISPCNHLKGKNIKYKCSYDECDRSFNIESGLERHKLVHTGMKPYECDYQECDQKFNQKSNLNRHRRIHTQQKPFICQKCCKSFTTTTNLKQHVQIHFEDKQKRKKYVCEMKGCNKQYLYMCNLKKHKQEHEDPMADCLGEKKPQFPSFCVDIGPCNFKIIYKESRDHYELLVTHREVANSIKYTCDAFFKVLEGISRDPKQQDRNDDNSYLQQMQKILINLLEPVINPLSICFEMHSDLSPVANILVKAAMSLAGAMGAKSFIILIPSYNTFRDIVQNLLFDLSPQSQN